MKVLFMEPAKAHAVETYGSQAFTLTHIAAGKARLSHAVLAPGGSIGRHPATQQQLLLVIEGGGEVSGDSGVFHPIAAGQAALWQPGEEHETRSEAGLTALIFEGEIERLSEQLQENSTQTQNSRAPRSSFVPVLSAARTHCLPLALNRAQDLWPPPVGIVDFRVRSRRKCCRNEKEARPAVAGRSSTSQTWSVVNTLNHLKVHPTEIE